MSKKYVASCSFGKDSIATLLLAKEHGEALNLLRSKGFVIKDAPLPPDTT